MKIILRVVAIADQNTSYVHRFQNQRLTRTDHAIGSGKEYRIEESIKAGEEYLISVDLEEPHAIMMLDEKSGLRMNTKMRADLFYIPPFEEVQKEIDKDRWDMI